MQSDQAPGAKKKRDCHPVFTRAGQGDSANQCEYRQNRQGLARVADETGGEISNDNDGQEDRPYEPEHPQA